MGFFDYISRHPKLKAKKVSAYDEEFIVAKLKLISASINSLDLKNSEPEYKLHQLIKAHDLASQITPKIEANNEVINLISAHEQVYTNIIILSLSLRESPPQILIVI